MNQLSDIKVASTLISLHMQAEADFESRKKQRAENRDTKLAQSTAYMAVTEEEGRFLYQLAQISKAKNIVEFGCSFGISTIYLAAAARENGGTVTTTELENNKVVGARKNITHAGLSDVVTILEGNALDTLSNLNHQIDFIFLDGAKELYFPVFELLEPKFNKQTVICADNVDNEGARPLLTYIQSAPSHFTSSIFFEGRMMVCNTR